MKERLAALNVRTVMFRSLLTLLALSTVLAAAVTPPDTPAGRVLSLWMDSLNSADRDRIAAFGEKHHPPLVQQAEGMARFSKMTGGFDLVRITRAEPMAVTGLVKERASDTIAEFDLKVEGEGENLKVAHLRLQQVPAPADLAPKRLPQAEIPAAVDRYVAERSTTGLSGAIVVSREGEPVVSKAFGSADRENNVPATLKTQFRIGSMNKMFTSVATLQLVENGKLELDKPIGTYLNDYPNKDVASKVTVRHLLTHTGGTGDIFGPEFGKNRLQLRGISDYVKLYGTRSLEFEPGAQWRYSNYGFVLLGAIIEAVSGQTYYDYVREQVFKPAGMTSTDSLPEEEKVQHRSVGYMNRDGKLVPNTDTLPWRGTSAGGGYSTVGDLQKFAEALLDGKLLKKETLAQATTNDRNNYGFGFGVRGGKGEPLTWGHGGGAPGMNGELRVLPDSGWVIVVLSNLDPPAASRLADYVSLRLPL
ncbi:MAG TPA: serine hydrolase domain-containing protein [Bryobacteraceae bacterium]|nr:serine hydrolase domain-containing protein [Bryobacteraceae bacterium]